MAASSAEVAAPMAAETVEAVAVAVAVAGRG